MKILDIRKGAFNSVDINETKDAVIYLRKIQYEVLAQRSGGVENLKAKAKARNINFILKEDKNTWQR